MAGISPSSPRAAFLFIFIGFIGPITAAEPSRADLDFFESRIRPILVNNCYKCHSQLSEKLKGGLRVDTQADLLKGGNTGPVIVPGHPESSLLIKAVRYRDEDLKMPPNDKKLTDAQIADLEQWVKMGAPDSRTGGAAKINLYEIDKANAAKHWAFLPIFPPREPKVDDAQHWAKTPVDHYILSHLRSEGLTPSPMADKVTLIRRASFDLTGLPPTLKEVDDFVADNSENAFSNVVARLLASPRYGERWGRGWLDVARYADTKGTAGNAEPRYLNSFTYRDYVIKAFNDDLPYDRFLLEQIAADKLPGENKSALAALGFLTLGNRFNNNSDDIIDDRIDVICKATLALTVNCARCHDHKFDPIPTQDYYSLHGVLNSCYEPPDGLPIQSPEDNKLYPKFKKELETRETELRNFRQQTRAEIKLDLISKSGQYLLALAEFHDPTNKFPKERIFASHNLNRRWAGGWEASLEPGRQAHARIFAPWTELAALNEFEFPAKVAEVAAKYRATSVASPVNPLVAQLLSPPPASLSKLAARYATLFMDVEKRWQTLVAEQTRNKNSEPTAFPDLNLEELRQLFYDSRSSLFVDEQLVTDTFNRSDKIRGKNQALEKAINDLKATHPGAPLRATVLVDKDDPRDSPVYLRGNPGSRGPSAPRRFLAILSGDDRPSFRDGSGRLELARAIASEDNPLTARVMVNRIWLGHFGEGLVRTPNDFGMRSEDPSHPELLDYLAWVFMEQGWSIKKMHQLIMLSSVYQQSSEDNPQYAVRDPNNCWLWRMNRRRLDFEAFRDTILAVGGKLDLTMGGRPVKLDATPYSERRTVYGLVDRSNLPTMYRAFDFANPDLSTGKRDLTTVPQQALFLMNSPLVVEQAMNLVRRPDFTAQANTQERVRLLYRLIYQRYPNRAELRLALTYLQAESALPKAPIPGESPWDYGLARFDPNSKRVSSFRRMAQFGRGAWVEPSGANLTAVGGYVPPFSSDALVRRWTSPVDGVFSIQGVLNHSGSGGVHVRIVSSQSGELGKWNASDGTTSVSINSIAVTEGDTIDFMVECQNKSQGENFMWSPIIRLTKPPPGAVKTEWNAQNDFSGSVRRHLHVWEKFAQVLLETNELTFYN